MFNTELFFVRFDPNEVDKTFKLNSRIRGVRQVMLYAKTHSGLDFGVNAITIRMDNAAMAIATENLAGFPVPVINSAAGAALNRGGGHVFEPPLLLANANWPSVQSIRIRLATLGSSAALTHNGMNFWFILRCQPETFDMPSIKNEQWLKQNTAMSGAGTNDYRWDYVPDQQEVAERLAALEERFSIGHQK